MGAINKRIKEARLMSKKTLEEVALIVGVSRQTIQKYESGIISNIPPDKIEKLAIALGTTPAALMGWDTENLPKGAMPVGQLASLPVLGRVCAGYGCLAQQEILYYEPADVKYATGEYFYLLVKGDSMSPHIQENDLVLVKSQTSVDSGDVAVVIVDDTDGVVKKVVYDETHIHLISFNPYYPERVFEGSDVLRVRVVGKVVESKRKW